MQAYLAGGDRFGRNSQSGSGRRRARGRERWFDLKTILTLPEPVVIFGEPPTPSINTRWLPRAENTRRA